MKQEANAYLYQQCLGSLYLQTKLSVVFYPRIPICNRSLSNFWKRSQEQVVPQMSDTPDGLI